MERSYRRTLYAFMVWVATAVLFGILSLSGGGPSIALSTGSWRHPAAAFVLLAGFVAYWVALFVTRKSGDQSSGPVLSVQARAAMTGLVVTIGFVFVVSIGLYLRFEVGGFVPVGWLWFLAYATFLVAWVVTSGTSLLLWRREAR